MINIVSNACNKNQIFEIGDLVIFSGISQQTIKNKIGIIIGHSINSLKDSVFLEDEWYVVQFGPMKLIVNDSMIEKLDPDDV